MAQCTSCLAHNPHTRYVFRYAGDIQNLQLLTSGQFSASTTNYYSVAHPDAISAGSNTVGAGLGTATIFDLSTKRILLPKAAHAAFVSAMKSSVGTQLTDAGSKMDVCPSQCTRISRVRLP